MEINRNNIKSSSAIFKKLIPNDQIKDVLEVVNYAVTVANEYGNDKWGITLKSNYIRLNVGKIEVLTIYPSLLHLILDFKSITDESFSIKELNIFPGKNEFTEPIYKSVKNSIACNIEYKSVREYFPKIKESFRNLIINAAKTTIHNMTSNAHSPAAIKYCSYILDKPMPQPLYYQNENDQDTKLNINEGLREGEQNQILTNVHERNQIARKACIEYYGTNCFACGLNFEKFYGEIGINFIHVHHLEPLSENPKEHVVDPIKDLRPICPNCHAMIHRNKDRLLTIEELQLLIKQ